MLAGVLAALWVWAEARSKHPLVDMQMMRLPGVWTTNLAALLIGFGMYSAFVLIPQFVQTPTSTGYGFGASVTQSGLYLVPSTIALIIFSPIGGRLSTIVGSKVPLIIGSAVTTVVVHRPRGRRPVAGRSTSPPPCSAPASASRSPPSRT